MDECKSKIFKLKIEYFSLWLFRQRNTSLKEIIITLRVKIGWSKYLEISTLLQLFQIVESISRKLELENRELKKERDEESNRSR